MCEDKHENATSGRNIGSFFSGSTVLGKTISAVVRLVFTVLFRRYSRTATVRSDGVAMSAG